MQNLADRIRAVRKKLGINQVELGDILGCTEGKIKGWEQGKTLTIKPKDTVLLESKYGFNREWLENGEGDMMINQGDLVLNDISTISAMLNGNISIPYYKDINASAGYGCTNGECKPARITLIASMLPVSGKNIEAIKVMGNSMSGTIEDDDVIFINKDDCEVQDGKIYVVYLCDEVYVKRLFTEPKTKAIILKSDNPLFPQLNADCDDFKVIGRVIANMQISKL